MIAATLRAGARPEGTPGDVFLLSGPNDPDTVHLPRRILNDTKSARSGRPCAWVQGQRYVSMTALTQPGVEFTSDLDSR